MGHFASTIRYVATLTVLLVAVVAIAALALGGMRSRGPSAVPAADRAAAVSIEADTPPGNPGLSKATLIVSGMSCSGCIYTIKSSLASLDGIGDIMIDIPGGIAEVLYDDRMLGDVAKISEAITAAGYPASVQSIVSPEALRAERSLADAKAQHYIASVGGWDIARSEFDAEVEMEKRRYAKTYGEDLFASSRGRPLMAQLQVQIVSRLLDEGVIMQEIGRSGYRVDAATVERGLKELVQKMGKSMADFESSLDQLGYDTDYFRAKLERNVLINRYIEDEIVARASNPVEKQSIFTSWYDNAETLAEVVYYDKGLEKLIRDRDASSGCGSSCSQAGK